MNITLFGATGTTGKFLIDEALRQGHYLTLYSRSESKVSEYASRADIVIGSLTDCDAIQKAIRHADVVISLLGPNSLNHPANSPVAKGMELILNTMRDNNIKRLIQVSTAAFRVPEDKFSIKSHGLVFLFSLLARGGYRDIKATARLVSKSNCDWTLVRIPNLYDGHVNTRVVSSYYGDKNLSMKLSRINLANFILSLMYNREYIRRAPAISDVK